MKSIKKQKNFEEKQIIMTIFLSTTSDTRRYHKYTMWTSLSFSFPQKHASHMKLTRTRSAQVRTQSSYIYHQITHWAQFRWYFISHDVHVNMSFRNFNAINNRNFGNCSWITKDGIHVYIIRWSYWCSWSIYAGRSHICICVHTLTRDHC